MAITINCEGILRDEQEHLTLIKQINTVCEREHLNVEWHHLKGSILICPQGDIEISMSENYAVLKTNTSLVGPGYHAYVAELFEKIVNEGPIYLSIDDECEYLEDHDFERLKEQYFYPYLSILMHNMMQMEENDEACYAWDNKMYLPLAKPYHVITPLGYLPVKQLATFTVEEAMPYFMIWNELARDAVFFRNSALYSLWNDCTFKMSRLSEKTHRITEVIIEALEKSHELDKTLAQPLHAYLECCEAIKHQPMIKNVEEFAFEEIGYRKEEVLYAYGNWLIYDDGCATLTIEGNTMELKVFDEEMEWQKTTKITGYRSATELNKFAESFVTKSDAIDDFEWVEDKIQCRGVVYECKDEESTTLIQAQFICGQETLLMSIEIADLSLQSSVIEKLHLMICLEERMSEEANVRI